MKEDCTSRNIFQVTDLVFSKQIVTIDFEKTKKFYITVGISGLSMKPFNHETSMKPFYEIK